MSHQDDISTRDLSPSEQADMPLAAAIQDAALRCDAAETNPWVTPPRVTKAMTGSVDEYLASKSAGERAALALLMHEIEG